MIIGSRELALHHQRLGKLEPDAGLVRVVLEDIAKKAGRGVDIAGTHRDHAIEEIVRDRHARRGAERGHQRTGFFILAVAHHLLGDHDVVAL